MRRTGGNRPGPDIQVGLSEPQFDTHCSLSTVSTWLSGIFKEQGEGEIRKNPSITFLRNDQLIHQMVQAEPLLFLD